MRTLLLPPERASYTPRWMPSGGATEDSAPVSLFRPGQRGSGASVGVQWVCDEVEYDYLMAFVRLTGGGAVAFLTELVIDGSEPTTYVAQIDGGSLSLASADGPLRTVSAMLTVVPTDRRAVREFAESAYLLLGGVGPALPEMLVELAHLTNVVMPEELQ